ncbi:hypothetical protein NE237_023133 [Protea cynaroides]|uniref:Uncharacterized protein n=1 Tax=Protea cynaroides TaxID=273540 RepID=A0A9Q0HCB9_9MAGN|nr:hypothetical protein NE237_023133 [Protea cynaroides]
MCSRVRNFIKCALLSKDIELMYTLKRPGSFFNNELADIYLSKEKYGSVQRFYFVAGEDLAIATDYQREMIAKFPVKEVKMINNSGHEVMPSKPLELSANILDIARQSLSSLETANAAGDHASLAGSVEMRTKPISIRFRRGAWWV